MVLDMSIDRVSYFIINFLNAIAYPSHSYIFILLILFDGVSHLAIASASIVYGGRTHKLKDEDTPWLLRMYYGTHLLLVLCLCSELFSVTSYLVFCYPFEGILGILSDVLLGVFAVGTFVKQLTNVAHIQAAIQLYQKILQRASEEKNK